MKINHDDSQLYTRIFFSIRGTVDLGGWVRNPNTISAFGKGGPRSRVIIISYQNDCPKMAALGVNGGLLQCFLRPNLIILGRNAKN